MEKVVKKKAICKTSQVPGIIEIELLLKLKKKKY